MPRNTAILATIKSKLYPTQQAVAKYIEDTKPEVGATPIAPPPGGGKIGDHCLATGPMRSSGSSTAQGAQSRG